MYYFRIDPLPAIYDTLNTMKCFVHDPSQDAPNNLENVAKLEVR